ncbi:MAG: hypothetical protein AABX13_04300 [Nanoarchaeota archaeon]
MAEDTHPISPSDPATQQRLEQIVERTGMDDFSKMEFFRRLGSEGKARAYEQHQKEYRQKSEAEYLEEIAQKLQKWRVGLSIIKRKPEINIIELRRIHEEHCTDPSPPPALEQIYQSMYKRAAKAHGFQGLAVHLGEQHLHLPETKLQPLREEHFYQIMTYFYSVSPVNANNIREYGERLQEAAEKIPPPRQRKIAERAYAYLLSEWSRHQDAFYHLFTAAALARQYDLGREKVLEPVGKYLSFYDDFQLGKRERFPTGFEFDRYQPPSYDLLMGLLDVFDLPPA